MVGDIPRSQISPIRHFTKQSRLVDKPHISCTRYFIRQGFSPCYHT